MRIPWRFIPELEGLRPEERRRLWQEARRDPFTAGDAVRAVGILAFTISYASLGIWVTDQIHIAWLSAPAFVIWLFAGWEVVEVVRRVARHRTSSARRPSRS